MLVTFLFLLKVTIFVQNLKLLKFLLNFDEIKN